MEKEIEKCAHCGKECNHSDMYRWVNGKLYCFDCYDRNKPLKEKK